MILRAGDYLQNRYEILQLIGSGGMSEVYRAHCHKLNRAVAIKVLKKEFCEDEEFVRKFKLEAQAAGGLSHPNIVNIYDVVDEETLHYIVMELVEGQTLKQYITQLGHLGSRETIEIAIQVAQGIGAAHQNRIIHRDIKPQNMILSNDGKVKVADFGIARAVTSQTISSQAIGSVHYISPEQARGEFTDERSDIYSLGITIYEMITGRLPFEGDTAVSVALAHLEEPVTPPGIFNPDIPAGLEKIILKCVEKDPEDRYQTIDLLIKDLREVLDNPDEIPAGATVTSSGTRIIDKREMNAIKSRSVQRRKKKDRPSGTDGSGKTLNSMLKWTGIAVVLALLAAGVYLFIQFRSLFFGVGGNPGETSVPVEETSSGQALNEKETFMPYIIGLTQAEAEQKLAESDLTLTVSSREYSEQFSANQIMGQSPEAGVIIPRYTKVGVVLSLGTAKIDLTKLGLAAMSGEDAKVFLEEQGFEVEITEEHSDIVEAGRIIDYSPERAEKGEIVAVKVSLGPEVVFSTVPNITGDPEQKAQQKLTAATLTVGKVTRVNSDTVPAGIVMAQSVNAGMSVESGSQVGYTLSLGPAEQTTAAESATAETDFMVEPIGGDAASRYVASINTTYELTNLIGPGSSGTSVTVMVRLRQEVSGQTVYQTLMEPRTVTADTIIPVRFRAIEGVYGVDTGTVEIVNTDENQVLKSFDVQFFKVQ